MLDLFSGIGGFALAAKWCWGDELDLVGFCEIEDYAQKVLQKNFPDVPIYKDIKKLDGKEFKNIDLITGGFPCQDISVAGRGIGLEEGTRSSLWFEMLRIIGEVRPRYALIENVPMLTLRGGTRVISDLTEIGYDSSWTIISAQDVGAWHRRKRIWIVAYLPDTKYNGSSATDGSGEEIESSKQKGEEGIREFKRRGSVPDVPHSESKRYGGRDSEECGTEGRELLTGKQGRSEMGSEIEGCGKSFTEVPDTESIRVEGNGATGEQEPQIQAGEGLSGCNSTGSGASYWAVEPSVGRVANGVPNRVDRLKGLGNAIVPQCAYEIMKRIRSLKLGN